MSEQTFSNLSILKEAQQNAKLQLGDLYEEKVLPFINILLQVMRANDSDVFTAMKMVKEKTDLYKKTDAPVFFASAVMEIVEEKHFVGFKS